MKTKGLYYDATREFRPLNRSKDYNGRHPRPRLGATRAKRLGITKLALHHLRHKEE